MPTITITPTDTAMTTDPRVRLLQFADGLFPAGGHAHSFGLETLVDGGRVHDRAGLEDFLRGVLEGSAGPCDAVFVVESLRRAAREDLGGVLALDAELDAMRPAVELREASRQMGRQTLRLARTLLEAPLLLRFGRAAESGETPAHHPIVFGTIGGLLGWTARDAATAYLQASATTIVQAALRLMPIGQTEGQKVLWAMGDAIGRLAATAADATFDDLWSFAPGQEIAAMKHARLDARLFRS